MIKITCDMCGEEIKNYSDLVTLDFAPQSLSDVTENKIELCARCSVILYHHLLKKIQEEYKGRLKDND